MTKSRNVLAPRRFWTAAELQLLRKDYPDTKTEFIANSLGRDIGAVYQKAAQLGLKKSETFLASDLAGRVQRGKQNEAMKASQFRPGQKPWNTGLKGSTGVQEGCRATQFKKGRPANEARNYKPIGSHRLSKDGYLEQKVTDDPSIVPARRWAGVHRLVWEAANGPVPSGHAVAFKPGRQTIDPELITLDALELVTRQELMRRNSVHTNYPPEVARVMQLRGALTRQINKRSKEQA